MHSLVLVFFVTGSHFFHRNIALRIAASSRENAITPNFQTQTEISKIMPYSYDVYLFLCFFFQKLFWSSFLQTSVLACWCGVMMPLYIESCSLAVCLSHLPGLQTKSACIPGFYFVCYVHFLALQPLPDWTTDNSDNHFLELVIFICTHSSVLR